MQKLKRAQSFEVILGEAIHRHEQAELERQELRDAISAKEKEKAEHGREIVRLQRIAYLAGYDKNPLAWQLREIRSVDSAWKHLYELETSCLSFGVSLYEATKLKKFKYVVEVRAWKTELSERPGDIHGGYRYTTYGKKKYMTPTEHGGYEGIKGQEMEKKFADLKAAEAYAAEWMGRLYEDHREEIEAERAVHDELRERGIVYDTDVKSLVPIAERDARRRR